MNAQEMIAPLFAAVRDPRYAHLVTDIYNHLVHLEREAETSATVEVAILGLADSMHEELILASDASHEATLYLGGILTALDEDGEPETAEKAIERAVRLIKYTGGFRLFVGWQDEA